MAKNIPNYYKIFQITTKYTKFPQNIPNDNIIYQTTIKILTFSTPRPSKMYPNWDFVHACKYTICQPWWLQHARYIHATIASANRTDDPGFESLQGVRFLGIYILQCIFINLIHCTVCTWEIILKKTIKFFFKSYKPWPNPDVKVPLVEHGSPLQDLEDVLRRRRVLQLLLRVGSWGRF
jgi:hypothetical protein